MLKETPAGLVNTAAHKGPRDHAKCDVWPRGREHLLDECYHHTLVSVMIKTDWCVSEALLHLHYPTLYENPMVLFCDTGEHIVIYLAEKIDTKHTRM